MITRKNNKEIYSSQIWPSIILRITKSKEELKFKRLKVSVIVALELSLLYIYLLSMIIDMLLLILGIELFTTY